VVVGYLDTGADDIVFPDAPKVTLYSEWHYVLVEAGPEQAATWRQSGGWSFWKGALPNLMFPADERACHPGAAIQQEGLTTISVIRPLTCTS
jgi:hypothetical protein